MTRTVRVLAAWLAIAAIGAAPAPVRAQAPRPITLMEALTLAAQHNHGLRVAAFEVTAARAAVSQARAFRSGLLTLNASYTRVNDRAPTTIVIPPGTIPGVLTPITITLPPASPNLYTVGVTYQLPLYSGGRNEAQVALAEANLRGAEAALERVKQQLVLDVKQAYYQVLLAQGGLEVADRTVAEAEENLRVARARVAAGASPRFDEIQAEVHLANARQGQIRSRNAVALALQGLNGLMAQPLDVQWAPREVMAIVPLRTAVAPLVRRALEARPELGEQQARIAAAQAAVEAARAGLRPIVAFQAAPAYGNTSGASLTGGGPATFSWSATLSATLTLFDGYLTVERIREAEARVEQLRAAEAQLRQVVEADVRRAVLNHQSAAEELAGADKAVELAQEGLRIANVRFAAGVSTNLEVVQAQAALSQAQANRLQALFNLNVARAQLERASGGVVE
jgi:outer membrane protein TolC